MGVAGMTNAAVGMPCPVCRVPLTMSERQGVEIDYCPQCRGVWLDRGELDKILERSARDFEAPVAVQSAAPAPAPTQHQPWSQPPQPGPGYRQQHPQPYAQGYDQSHGHQGGYGKHGYPKRKKSFLEDLFD